MQSSQEKSASADRMLVWSIAVIVAIYAASLAAGVPQRATATILASHAHEETEAHDAPHDEHGMPLEHEAGGGADHAASHSAPGDAAHSSKAQSAGEPSVGESSIDKSSAGAPLAEAPHSATASSEAHESSASHADKPAPPALWAVLPFVVLLGMIATLPLIHLTEHWWDHNLNKFLAAAALALVTLAYYVVIHEHAIERHFVGHGQSAPTEGQLSWNLGWTTIENAILNDYVPFMVLLLSLYTISGGIRIEGDLPAHPGTNTAFLAVGGLLASFVGTTGAAMLLVRPLLETNSERRYVKHTVVFFIFVVCNCGGCLLPLGDPPLFLGYLQGVDFLWTLSLWREWLFVNGALLVIYFVWDKFWIYPKESRSDLAVDELRTRALRFSGLWPNVALLAGVVLSVALLSPTRAIPGTDWHPWLYLREIVQLGLVGLSLALGSSDVRRANRFSYVAIVEVAALFLGIFVCMQPALQILNVNGAALGISSPVAFFWTTGALSSVLDNAPTYLVFFETARALGTGDLPAMAGVEIGRLTGISLGAVFMGSMTYIGNGPNFMVKTIAEKSGVKMPSFFGYVVYSAVFLLPLFVVMNLLFLRH